MNLLLIRHGETETNIEGLIHKLADETGLTELGRKQSKEAGFICKHYNVDCLYSSPEKRALETAVIISEIIGVPYQVIRELHERDWGDWSGKSWDEIKKILDTMSLEECYTFTPPRGESWKQMDLRLKKTIEQISSKECYASAIVTHGGAIRALIPLLKAEAKERSFQYNPPNGSVIAFEFNEGRYKEIVE